MPSAWAELGNLDGNNSIDPNWEYPAVGGIQWWDHPGYHPSVAMGREELVQHLNDRVTRPGCDREAIVLGGYSQGADVIGDALQDPDLHNNVLDNVVYAALYADPTYYNGGMTHCAYPNLVPRQPWARGDADCVAQSVPIEQRVPYTRAGRNLSSQVRQDLGEASVVG